MSFSKAFSSEPWQIVNGSSTWTTSAGNGNGWTSSTPSGDLPSPSAPWSTTWNQPPQTKKKTTNVSTLPVAEAAQLLSRFAELSFAPVASSASWEVTPISKKQIHVEIPPQEIDSQPTPLPQEDNIPLGGTNSEDPSEEDKQNIEDELSKQSLYKTELCRSFGETGACRYGHKCQFAHGENELRVILRHPKYKTENCKTFVATGTCPYGPRCRFIHPVAANAARPTQKWLNSWNVPQQQQKKTGEEVEDPARLAIFKNIAS